MGEFEKLIQGIKDVIKENHRQEITGQVLQDVLVVMVRAIASGSALIGIVDAETQPGTPDGNVAYIAGTGIYPNFGEGIAVPEGNIGLISNATGEWTVQTVPVGKNYDSVIKILQNTLSAMSAKIGDLDFSKTNYLTKQTDLTGAAKTLDAQAKLAMDEIDILGASEKDIVYNLLPKKQDKLVSGENIKTLNGESLLGKGDITLDLSLYKVVETLPTQNIDPNKIYLVLDTSGTEGNIYKEYVYIDGEWEELGEYRAEIDLTPYLTKEDASQTYETKEDAEQSLAAKQDKTDQSLKTEDKTVAGAINEVYDALVLLNRDLEKYDTSISLPMSVEKSGKYVDPDGQEKSSASMGISAPLEIRSGNIYLLQCAAAVGTGVALFSRKVTNTYDKAIAYSYTYNGDGTIATATADYDPELVYSYSYNEEGVATITDKDGETVPELPATHQVTESFYEPLFRTNDATMPKSGYYLLLCTQDMEIVVSAASSDITGKNLLGVRYGVFASIATNFVGSPGQKVIAQAFAELYAAVQALSSVVDNAGHLKADVLDMANLPKVCGEDMYLTGEGAPAAPPTVPFQEYYDSENLKFYKAKGVLPDSPTTGDWVAIN